MISMSSTSMSWSAWHSRLENRVNDVAYDLIQCFGIFHAVCMWYLDGNKCTGIEIETSRGVEKCA